MESTTAAMTVGFALNFDEFLNDSTENGDDIYGDNGTDFSNHTAAGMQSGTKAALWTFHFRVVPSFYLVLCVVGLLGNGVVISALCSIMMKNTMKSVTDILVINLAAADFIFVGSLPFWAVELFLKKRWVFGTFGCKSLSFITLLNLYGSVFFLVAMGIDRYLAVVYAVRARNYRTARNAIIASITIWILASMVAMQALLWREVDDSKARARCVWAIPETFTKPYYGIRMTLGFFLPFVVIVYCYILIMVKLHNRVSSRGSAGSCMTDRQKKITRAILAVISLFVACWLPNHVVTMILAVTVDDNPARKRLALMTANLVSVCLAYANSAINPILYAFMKEEIRQEGTDMLLRFFSCCRGSQHRFTRRRRNSTGLFGMKLSFWRSNNHTTVLTAVPRNDDAEIHVDGSRKNSEIKYGSPDDSKSSQDSVSAAPTTPGVSHLNGDTIDQNFDELTDVVDKVNLMVTLGSDDQKF